MVGVLQILPLKELGRRAGVVEALGTSNSQGGKPGLPWYSSSLGMEGLVEMQWLKELLV